MRVLIVVLLLLLGATPAAAAPAPLGGGSILTSASFRCTATFAATHGTTGQLVTGRCASTGTQLFSNNVPVGPITAASAAAALVTVSNTTAWTLVPWIPVGGAHPVITGSTETPVGGSSCSTVGVSYFLPIRPILSAYGLTLVTA